MTVTPNAIPVRVVEAHVLLCPESVERLFGKGYDLRGSERVAVEIGGRERGRHPVRPGSSSAVVADALLAAELRKTAGTGMLRGPSGTRPLPEVRVIPRRLILPKALSSVWKINPGSSVRIELGTVTFSRVLVSEGGAPAFELSEPDLLLAGGETARLAVTSEMSESKPDACAPCAHSDESARLITENDIRKARMERRRIVLRPGQLITPAARSLAKEFGILDES